LTSGLTVKPDILTAPKRTWRNLTKQQEAWMDEKVRKTEQEWRQRLTPEQYHVLREKGTEPPFSGEYENTDTDGVYLCAACGQELFPSEAKFASGCGWPSFFAPTAANSLQEREDTSHGMRRMEVTCSRCDAHLGHVFPDGPRPTGLRYCINSVSLKLQPK
jgi:peptide-methionine (R)-S-oxide reductase